MKKLALVLCLLMIFASMFTLVACVEDQLTTDSLVVYNWADYIYDYEDDFKAYYKSITGKNIQITYVTFDTNETMLTKITKGDSNVDVVCPSEYAIQKLMEMDYLVPLNYFGVQGENGVDYSAYTSDITASANYVHNAANVDTKVVQKISETFGDINGKDMLDYMVPYMYGTLGILYNKYAFLQMFDLTVEQTDKLAQIMNDANWGILFNNDKNGQLLHQQLTGQILMKDSIRDTYAATIFYLRERGLLGGLQMQDGTLYESLGANQLINCVDDQLLEVVKNTLTEQKQQLFGYEVDFGKDDLLKGNAMVDLAWSGDAMYAVEESWSDALDDYELSYYVPHGAGNLWFDGWVIPKTYNPDHAEAIKLFINFLNSPKSAAANMMEIGYSSAVNPNAILADAEAKKVLAEVYCVNDKSLLGDELWTEMLGNQTQEDAFDYQSWQEFEDYFFHYQDAVDGTNWRYPLESDFSLQAGLRNDQMFGVMRDFGEQNKKVVTMWNYVRSAGVTAVPVFLWVLLAVVVVVGGAFGIHFLKVRLQMKVKVDKK